MLRLYQLFSSVETMRVKHFPLFIVLHSIELLKAEVYPLHPHNNSYFSVENWRSLVEENEGDLAKRVKLYEIYKNGEEILIGQVDNDDGLSNNVKTVNLCLRHTFLIKIDGQDQDDDDSGEKIDCDCDWNPPVYANVSCII